MNRSTAYLAALGALLVVALTVALWAQQPTLAQTAAEEGLTRQITVTGQGSAASTPDTAVVRLGVTSTADEPEAALNQVSRQTRQVIQRLQDLGIAQADIQTSILRLHPLRGQPEQPGARPEITGYEAINTLNVTIEEIDQASELLGEVVAAGANRVEGISFQLSDQADLVEQARTDAIADAQRAAEQFAQAAGTVVGPVLMITDQSGRGPGVPPGLGGAAEDTAGVPVAPGEQTVQVDVQVTFMLQQPARGTNTDE